MSVAHKYALTQVLCIRTEDPEADAETHEIAPQSSEDAAALEMDAKVQTGSMVIPVGEYAGKRIADLGKAVLIDYLPRLREALKNKTVPENEVEDVKVLGSAIATFLGVKK